MNASDPPSLPSGDPEPTIDSLPEDGIEISLDELGRAYAKAVGLVPNKPPPTEPVEKEPVDDNRNCELSPKSILEAILFVGTSEQDEPLTAGQIASWIRDVSPDEISQLACELQEQYEQEGSAFRVECDRNHLKLGLAEEYNLVRQSFYGQVRKARLSQQAIDVLAIVAYNQPVNRETVSELRGRDCTAILYQLVKRNLLSAETSEPGSRVKLYRTTDRFLDLFGLDSLDDLPQSEDIEIPE